MKLKLSVLAAGQPEDVVVTADGTATVGDLAERIHHRRPQAGTAAAQARGLAVNPGTPQRRVVDPATPLSEAGIHAGDVVYVTSEPARSTTLEPSVATLHVLVGPEAPATFPLRRGSNVIGRDRSCDVRLADPLVSKRHVRVEVTDMVEVVDEGSANGLLVSGQVVERAILRPGDEVTIGDTTVAVTLHATSASQHATPDPTIAFNRSPRLDPHFAGVELVAPEPPQPSAPFRFPAITLIAPVVMAGMIYAITRNAASILFVALSPLMLIGSYVENRMSSKRSWRLATAQFDAAITELAVQLQHATDLEKMSRRREHPAVDDVLLAVGERSSLVWTRRPEHRSFLQLRLGLGVQPSHNTVRMPTTNNTTPTMWRQLNDVAGRFATVDRVPVIADLAVVGNIGVAGPPSVSGALARGVLVQLLGLHSPAEVVVAAVAASGAEAWDWMKWLPHVGSEFSPLPCGHLAGNSAEAGVLVEALEQLVDTRSAVPPRDGERRLPAVVVFIHDDAPAERARLVQLAERGPAVGVHTVWLAPSVQRLPAPCRAFLDGDPSRELGRAGLVIDGVEVSALEVEPVDSTVIEQFARRLAPLVDSGALVADDSDLPTSVSYAALAGPEVLHAPGAIVDLWRETNSLPPRPDAPRRRRDNTLRAVVGQGTTDAVFLDLRTHGPHTLVGGTTGAGKSEFLQSWVLGMATMHSPARVTFLFVDYKGGAAFAECVDLPHSVGLVTDLNPHLVGRALTSLEAEVRHREQLLNRKEAKDLLELERRNDPDCPPSLVIVVDEFAALVAEVPAFVDGVVNIAQRGRSLGLHLVLATQRPAGVIKDNLRANTNLRIALRMADDADSIDVIDTALAAGFDPAVPGRAVVKSGPGRITPFQSAYTGGRTTSEPPPPHIVIEALRFGAGARWETPEPDATVTSDDVAPDIERVVATVRRAAESIGIPAPRRPWLDPLAPAYRLEGLPTERTDHRLVFGVADDPRHQSQPPIAFEPDRDGNMVVYGTGGTGKSTFLRTIAVAAAFAPARGGPCWVYGVDFGARGLSMLEVLPHVGAVIGGEDDERLTRLLRWLRAEIDDRAVRFAAVNAGDLTEHRIRSGAADLPRILVLVDGVGAFRQAYEGGDRHRWWDLFQAIAADGRSVGVHVVMSADRVGALPSGLASAVQRRLVLRLAAELDYAMLGVPADAFSAATPPGRGFDDVEVQVAVVGGDPNVARQAFELEQLAVSMQRAGIGAAPGIERLSDRIALGDLPVAHEGDPVVGVWDETLGPIGFEATGTFVVAGPPRSGRSTTVATLVRAVLRHDPGVEIVLLADRRSPLVGSVEWTRVAVGATDIEALATDLAVELASDGAPRTVVVIESVGDLLNTEADIALQDLVKACRASGHLVIAEGETTALAGSWPLLQAVKAGRAGIVLQPDQIDGDGLFRTPFPRTARAQYPAGRGLLARGGRAYRVQVALPA